MDRKVVVIPPAQLDGAMVIEWAWSGTAPFGLVPATDGSPGIPIFGLAICRYEGSDSCYRFSCDQNWETVQDAEYGSVLEAKASLPAQYTAQPVIWRPAPADQSPLYCEVRLTKIGKRFPAGPPTLGQRAPQIGDLATIIEIYDNPPGYELECFDDAGRLVWLATFKQGEVAWEWVSPDDTTG
ncbi:MAG: hypothetical protein H6651_18140 [Ardenticatenales bacterium]|nr:hypothetical protein [Ardenticatenales bacterium]